MLKEKSDAFKRDIDFYKVVGRKIKEARQTNINQFTGKCFLITQTKVAKAIGTTFQTIQKYEKGHNRIPLSQLLRISSYLKKPLSYFGLESFREEQE
jgi:transcriptional regulator with XRE-family HTH domain